MTPSNKAYSGAVRFNRAMLSEFLSKAQIDKIVLPSRHLAERMVERNIDPLDIFRMSVPIVKFFRETTFNDKTILVVWRDLKLAAQIQTGSITGQRHIMLKTIIDDIHRTKFDETFKMV